MLVGDLENVVRYIEQAYDVSYRSYDANLASALEEALARARGSPGNTANGTARGVTPGLARLGDRVRRRRPSTT